MEKPCLLVVTGRPGAGKTTFARQLSSYAYLPLLSRDAIKEGLVHTCGKPHASLPTSINAQANAVFFDTVESLLERGISLVIEAAFQHRLWQPQLERLAGKAQIILLLCTASPQVALERFLARGLADEQRVYFHGDPGVQMLKDGVRPQPGPYEAPHLPYPTFCVNTEDGYQPSIESLWQSIQAALGR